MLLICSVLLITACKSKQREELQSGYRMEGDTVYVTAVSYKHLTLPTILLV